MNKESKSYWQGAIPQACQICNTPLTTQFVDGATVFGSWAYMCKECHSDNGYGLGTGRGQLYIKKGNQFVKEQG